MLIGYRDKVQMKIKVWMWLIKVYFDWAKVKKKVST